MCENNITFQVKEMKLHFLRSTKYPRNLSFITQPIQPFPDEVKIVQKSLK